MTRSLVSAYKILGWGCIGVAVVLVLLRLLCPYLMPSTVQLEKWVKTQLSYPTKIKDIELTFDGYQPALTLSHVQIYSPDSHHHLAAHIDKIQLLLNIPQLLMGRMQLDKLNLIGANVGIEYDGKGMLSVSGLPDLTFNLHAPVVLQKMPVLKSLFIQDSHIHFMLGQKRSLPLTQVKLSMGSHIDLQVRASATVVGLTPSHIEFGADLPLWDLPLQSGEKHFYCHWQHADLNQLEHFFAKDLPMQIHDGLFSFETWITLNNQNELKAISEIEFQRLQIHHEKENLSFKKITGQLLVNNVDHQWTILGDHWDFHENKPPLDFKIQFIASDIAKHLRFNAHQFPMILLTPLFPPRWEKYFAVQQNAAQGIIDYASAVIDWEKQEDNWVVRINDFQTKLNESEFFGSLSLNFSPDQKLPTIDMFLEANKMHLQNVIALLPHPIMDNDLIAWLTEALPGGGEVTSSMILRGNLADFPFDSAQGIFEAQLHLEHVEFAYDKHWPHLTDLNADLLFHNRSLFIHADSGMVAGGKIVDADAVIPDLHAKIPQLTVDTEIVSTLQNGIHIINQSPLKNTLAKTLAPLTFEGEMALSLGLMIPLSLKSTQEITVKGIVEVMDATVVLPWNIAAKALKGSVTFTQNAIKAQKLEGQLFEGPVQLEIDTLLTSNEPQMLFQAQGHVKLAELEKALNVNMHSRMGGETDYSALLTMSSQHPTEQFSFVVHSDLVGIPILAPIPFGKTVSEAKPSELKLSFDHNDLMRVAFKYGDELNGVNSFTQTNAVWRLVGGHFHLGENRLAKFREDGIFLIDGDLKELNFPEWKRFLAQSAILGLLPSNGAENEHSLEPMLQLNVENLMLLDNVFSKTKIDAQWERSSAQWNVHFDGAALKGQVIFPHQDNRDILVNLQSLDLSKTKPFSGMLSDTSTLSNPISLQIKKLILDKKMINQVQARIEPTAKGYNFPKVKANLTGTHVDLSGQWDYLLPSKQVTIKGKMTTSNITHTLKELGIKSTLKKAKGDVHFALNWIGTPGTIDYPTLNGQADFHLTKGYINGMNSGIGRVLSLVNLDNVQRRLNFDFSDVTKKGFAFDELSGKCQFGKGKMSSNNVIINGPSAKIEAVGQADLINQGVVGEIVVMPNVTASLPVAAAIAAGNPAVGAAVWVVDKMVGNKIQSINKLRYQIAGTWQAPQVNPMPFSHQS